MSPPNWKAKINPTNSTFTLQLKIFKFTLLVTFLDYIVTSFFLLTNICSLFTIYLETDDEDGNRLYIEAVDTLGFSDDVDPQDVCNKVMQFIENTYDEVFEEESRVRRNPKFEEHRVHAVLYLIEPTGLELKAVDAEFIKKLSERSNVIPIIAKADSMTAAERQKFKAQLSSDFSRQGINIYNFADYSDIELGTNGFQIRKDMQPLSVIGSVEPRINDAKKGRPYPWGMAECENISHCDLSILTTAIFTVFREELKEVTEDALYEKYRTEKLEKESNGNKKASEKIIMHEQLANLN
jgi:cell division control protein 11